MPFNINQFKAQGLINEGARPSMFDVSFVLPVGIGQGMSQRITVSCEAASLPPARVGTIKVPYFGRMVPFAGDREFPDWTILIQNDEDFQVRSIFEHWNNNINELVGNIRLENAGLMEDYMVDALVTQYSKTGAVIRQYNFVNMYPNAVEAITLDWGAQNQIEKFGVNLSYWYWVPSYEGQDSDTYLPYVDTNDILS